ncbi:protease modulator HflC [Hyphococcus luteus]|uniref:Protein HflC n=1 Tax=Hyphococcus luteus TaxID=2058213 RepID=A0A2S7K4A9_9PROT|nr:protease modulator HflC [Marinicaulis flavus]PQA87332.1 protease modulator HflC [Marinicaulis flavus]
MSKLPLSLIGVAAAILLFVLFNSAFIVPETRSALVFRFGEPKNQYTEAGLRFKAPFIENVRFIDQRNRNLDQEPTEIIARNQERLIVDAFARYKITDPLLFYQRVSNEERGERRLGSILEDAIRAELGSVTVDEIVSERRSELMAQIQEELTTSARPLGVEIIDVKIRRADLPQTNSEAVFQRMIAERRQLAQQYRSEGNERANQIRAQADRQVIEIKAKAEEQAQTIRGEADAERNAIFAAAYGKDPEFFAFYRSLLAYEEALQNGETTILLSPNSEFFRYFNNLQGQRQ